MNKEVLNLYQAQQKRVDFIEKAVGEGVLNRLDRIGVSERAQNIGIVSILNETSTDEELGKIFPKRSGEPITQAGVSLARKKFLIRTWGQASPQLQVCCPLEELLMRKPHMSDQVAQVKNAMEKGINPKDLGLPSSSLATTRTTLRKYGIEVPSVLTYANFEARVEAAGSDNKKLQEILDSFTDDSIRGYIQYHRKDEEKVLTFLSPVLRKAGFYFNAKFVGLFAHKLQAKDMPIIAVKAREGIYWVVYGLDAHREKIIDVLKDDPDLQEFKKNPVQLAFGAFEGELPKATELMRKKGYDAFGNVVYETLGIRIAGRPKITPASLLDGCPVPIFRFSNRFSFPLSQKVELQNFLRKRYQELQSANPNSKP